MSVHKIFKASLATVIATVVSSTVSTANVISDVGIFDHNKNGQIDREEWSALAKHLHEKLYRDLDTNGDGVVELSSIKKLLKQADKDAEISQGLYDQKRRGRQGVPIAEAEQMWGVKKKKNKINLPFKLRGSVKGVSVLKDIDQLISDDPAKFSYVHDFTTKNDIWSAKGAIIYPFRVVSYTKKRPPNHLHLDTIATAFSISFDQVSNQKVTTQDIDKIGFHLLTELELVGGFLDAHYLTYDASFTTDHKVKSAIISGDADWRPVFSPVALNSIWYLNKKIGVQGYAIGRLRVARVLKTGGNLALRKKEFVQIGGEIGADVYFGDSFKQGRWLHASVRWNVLKGISGSKPSSKLLTTALNYYPSGNQNLGLSLTYRVGKVPLVETKTNELTVGLSAKF